MPPYPLYGETTTALPGSSSSTPLHTHSNKFPIEREVILSCADKNTKIPILQEYRRKERSKTMATISPDIPNKLIAWTNANNTVNGPQGGDSIRPHGGYTMSSHQATYSGGAHTGAVARTYDSAPRGFLPGETQLAIPVLIHNENTITRAVDLDLNKSSMSRTSSDMVTRHFPTELRDEKTLLENLGNTSSLQELTDMKLSKDMTESEKNKAFPTRTYHTLKGMISSRFNKSKDLSETSLNKSSSSLAETSNVVTLNNIDREGNRSTLGKEENARAGEMSVGQMSVERESAYARMPLASDPRPVQSSGQCVVNMESKTNANRVIAGDTVHSTNQAVYAERNAISNSTPKQGEIIKSQAFYADHNHRKPNTSQYAKPNTQQTHYPDQNSGIYMVMRQGRAQYPPPAVENGYQPDMPQQQNLATPGYSQQNFSGHNGSFQALSAPASGQSKLVQQHNTVLNKMGGFSQHHYPTQQISSNTYQALPMGSSSTNEPLPVGGQIGPGLTYQHQAATNLKLNGTIGSSGTYTKEPPISSDHLDGSKDLYGNKSELALPGEYSIKEEKSAAKKSANGGFRKSKFGLSGVGSGSGQSSDYDKTNVDSGRGSAISGQQMNQELAETSEESSTTPQGNDAEWVDLVESELRQILDPHTHHQSTPLGPGGCGNNSTISDSISSMTPPLPPLSPGGGGASRYKLSHNSSGMYGIKQDYGPIDGRKTSQAQGRSNTSSRFNWSKSSDRNKSALLGGSVTDITSTTGTGLDSLLDEDVATSIATGDARAIRHQLEGLENMYSQVLQLLGVKRQGMKSQGYLPSDPRFNKRRFHGSVSSVPSSVSSRPIRDKRRQDERKKVKDIKGINKRFQRLESHVVTLARSVAHLSSEMRTQHLMIQEMENIRSELSALRTHTMASANRSQSMPRLSSALSSLPSITNPTRVKKLTKFFGDEPPLLRLFLKKLGYEKYASVFESEQVGMVELPYMSEDRLQSMGIPLGPRLRILQEAHVSVLTNDQLCVI